MNQVDKNQLMTVVVNEIQRLSNQNLVRQNLMQMASANQQVIGQLVEVAYWLSLAAVNTPGCTNYANTIASVVQDTTRWFAGYLGLNNPQVTNNPNIRPILQNMQQDAQQWAAAVNEAGQIQMNAQQQMQMMQPNMMNMNMGMGVQQQQMGMGLQQGFAMPNMQQPAIPAVTPNRITFGTANQAPAISGDPMSATRRTVGGGKNSKVRRPGQPHGKPAPEPVAEPVAQVEVVVPAQEEVKLSIKDWNAKPDVGIMYLHTFDERYSFERFHRDKNNNVFQEVVTKGKTMSDQDYERHRTAFLGTRYAVKGVNPDNSRQLAKTVSQVRKAMDETVQQQKQYVDGPDGVLDLTATDLPIQVCTDILHVTTMQDAYTQTRAEHLFRQAANPDVQVMARTVVLESSFEMDLVPEHLRDNDYDIIANMHLHSSLIELVESLKKLSDEFKLIHYSAIERTLLDEINYQLHVAFSMRGARLTSLMEDVYHLDDVIKKFGGITMLQKWKEFEPTFLGTVFSSSAALHGDTSMNVDAPDDSSVPERNGAMVVRIARLATVVRLAVHRNDLNFAIEADPLRGRMVGRDNAPFLLSLIGEVMGSAMWARSHLNYYIMTMDGYVVRATLGRLAPAWLISEASEQLRA